MPDRLALLALCAVLGGAPLIAVAGAEPSFRHRAAIAVEQSAPFVRLALPPAAYARTVMPGLADLRVVDARGERVPFALLAPRPEELQTVDTWRAATLYPLPQRAAGSAAIASPVDLRVEGGRITIRQRGAAQQDVKRSPGWLVDLGERSADAPAPRTLRLQWSGPAEFSAGYAIEYSAELRQWQRGTSGQVMALATNGGALTQPDILLPAAVPRFVRIVWAAGAEPPVLTGATAATPATHSVLLDAPVEMQVATSTEPSGPHAGEDATRALHFDLGALMPIVSIDLELPPETRVLPAHVQVRARVDAPWQRVAGAVFYRIVRGAESSASPALALHRTARYVRIVPDPRGALPDAQSLRLVARLQLASLVFARQGEAPYALLAGARDASAGALPLSTLIPHPEQERPRFGNASLGPWAEVAEVAREVQAEERRAALRPWVLWAVLVGGVALLAAMVWRLARAKPGGPAPQSSGENR